MCIFAHSYGGYGGYGGGYGGYGASPYGFGAPAPGDMSLTRQMEAGTQATFQVSLPYEITVSVTHSQPSAHPISRLCIRRLRTDAREHVHGYAFQLLRNDRCSGTIDESTELARRNTICVYALAIPQASDWTRRFGICSSDGGRHDCS